MIPALQQFAIVTLPIMVTLVITVWLASRSRHKHFDVLSRQIEDFGVGAEMSAGFGEVNRHLDEMLVRLDRIERKLDNHRARIPVLRS